MESRPQNTEFRNNPGNYHPWLINSFPQVATLASADNLC